MESFDDHEKALGALPPLMLNSSIADCPFASQDLQVLSSCNTNQDFSRDVVFSNNTSVSFESLGVIANQSLQRNLVSLHTHDSCNTSFYVGPFSLYYDIN